MGFDIDLFEGEIDQELVCSICMEVFDEPVQDEEEHMFCKDCIYEWLKNNARCPLDRKDLFTCSLKKAPRVLVNLISNLKIKCKNCEIVLSLAIYKNHLKRCHLIKLNLDCEKYFSAVYSLKLPKDWLSHCIEAISITEKSSSNSVFQKEIYNELLNIDLNQLKTESLPSMIFQDKIDSSDTFIHGTYFLQIDLCYDSTKSPFFQIKEFSPDQEKDQIMALEDLFFSQYNRKVTQYDIKPPARHLIFRLTDGTKTIKAVEKTILSSIDNVLMAGTKVLLRGPVTYSDHILYLNSENIEVLGGNVPEIGTKEHFIKSLHEIIEKTIEKDDEDELLRLTDLSSLEHVNRTLFNENVDDLKSDDICQKTIILVDDERFNEIFDNTISNNDSIIILESSNSLNKTLNESEITNNDEDDFLINSVFLQDKLVSAKNALPRVNIDEDVVFEDDEDHLLSCSDLTNFIIRKSNTITKYSTNITTNNEISCNEEDEFLRNGDFFQELASGKSSKRKLLTIVESDDEEELELALPKAKCSNIKENTKNIAFEDDEDQILSSTDFSKLIKTNNNFRHKKSSKNSKVPSEIFSKVRNTNDFSRNEEDELLENAMFFQDTLVSTKDKRKFVFLKPNSNAN
jgi:hypothetical protein